MTWLLEFWRTRTTGQRVAITVLVVLFIDGVTKRYIVHGVGEVIAMVCMAIAGFVIGYCTGHDERDSD